MELSTLEWVDRFNNKQLFGPLGDISPREFEEAFYAANESLVMGAGLNWYSLRRTRGDSLALENLSAQRVAMS